MKIVIIACLGFFLSVGVLSGQETLTFDGVIAIALEQNHQIEIARNNAAVAANNAGIGNADLLPRVNLSGGASVTDAEAGTSTSTNASATASYTLFDGFGNIYRFKELQAGKRLGRLDARDQIESTLVQVGEAYYAAASAYERLRIAEDLLSISRERLVRAEKRSVYGQAGTIDVLAARVDLNTDSVTWTQALFAWDESRRGLNVFLNRDVDETFLVDTAVNFRSDLDSEMLKTEALARNAEYLAAGERLNQARYDLAASRAAHLPQLDLSASYGLSQNAGDIAVRLDDPAGTATVGATLSLTLFNGFKTHIQRQNAAIAVRNQTLLREQALLDLDRAVTSALEAYRNSLVVLNLEERSLEAAELNFRRTQELYQLGQVTTTQFREAQLNLIQARSDLSDAKYEAKLQEIALLRLSGRLLTDGED
jgi:outer membrane protein